MLHIGPRADCGSQEERAIGQKEASGERRSQGTMKQICSKQQVKRAAGQQAASKNEAAAWSTSARQRQCDTPIAAIGRSWLMRRSTVEGWPLGTRERPQAYRWCRGGWRCADRVGRRGAGGNGQPSHLPAQFFSCCVRTLTRTVMRRRFCLRLKPGALRPCTTVPLDSSARARCAHNAVGVRVWFDPPPRPRHPSHT